MSTRPFTFTGAELVLNMSTSAGGSIRVEVQDAAGQALPGFGLDDCPELIGDEIARTVAWKHGPDVSALAGQAVRLRFALREADLFSLQFRDVP